MNSNRYDYNQYFKVYVYPTIDQCKRITKFCKWVLKQLSLFSSERSEHFSHYCGLCTNYDEWSEHVNKSPDYIPYVLYMMFTCELPFGARSYDVCDKYEDYPNNAERLKFISEWAKRKY